MTRLIYLFIVEFVRFLINIYMKQLGIDHAIGSSEVTRDFSDLCRKGNDQEKLLIFDVQQPE